MAILGIFLLPLLLSACRQPPPHERVGWKAEEFFTDAKVIALCQAIEAKDLNKIDELIKDGADVNAKGRGNMTPLLWAFPAGEAVFQRLLEHGADPNVQVTMRMRPGILPSESVTHLAAYTGIALRGTFPDVAMDNYLKLVLAHGGDPKLETNNGETPLFAAVSGGPNSSDRTRMLLKAGADINHRSSNGRTPAIFAECSWHYIDLLILLEAGADCRIITDNGNDLVFFVAERTQRPPRLAAEQAVCDFLEKQGYNLAAARQLAANGQRPGKIPADQRPWLNPGKEATKKPQLDAK